MYLNCRSASVQKYRTTFSWVSDSRSNATSLSASVKQSGSNRFTATCLSSNVPLNTNVPSQPFPKTSLGLNVIFPISINSSENRLNKFKNRELIDTFVRQTVVCELWKGSQTILWKAHKKWLKIQITRRVLNDEKDFNLLKNSWQILRRFSFGKRSRLAKIESKLIMRNLKNLFVINPSKQKSIFIEWIDSPQNNEFKFSNLIDSELSMRKFCFYFPLVESGLVIGVFGIIAWILYIVQAFYERNLSCE